MIRNVMAIAAIALCAYAVTAQTQPVGGIVDTTNIAADNIDTLLAADDSAVDTLNVKTAENVKTDKDVIDLNDDELLQAALAVDSVKPAPSTQKLDLIRREHEYKKQTRAAIIMMIFIAAAMATSQSWNPR